MIWGNRGAAVVEFAVLFLLLLIIIFGVVEFGFIWLQSHYIANAAREGARVAARLEEPTKNGSEDQDNVENAVKEYLKGVYAETRVDGAGGCCNNGNFIEVDITDKNELGDPLVIEAGLDGDNPDAVKVTVTVKISEVWDPVLWDLLKLLPTNPDPGNITDYQINEFAVFAVEP